MRRKKSIPRFYWDSCSFLAWLLPEQQRKERCQEVLEAAEEGECCILTSALTLTEVIKLKNHPPLRQEREEAIRRFFENEFIYIRQVDRFLAEYARRLIWEAGVKPKDSIHLATALQWQADELHTFDSDLLDLDGKYGEPTLRICEPAAAQRRILTPESTEEAGQNDVPDPDEENAGEDEGDVPESDEVLGFEEDSTEEDSTEEN